MDNYQIKLLAAFLMLIDHVGVVFFPDVIALRIIGRFSFPLFIWLLVEGEKHTRNYQRYAIRLLLFGLISQPFYYLLFDSIRFNILFTLLLGLICLRLARIYPQVQLIIWLTGGAIAQLLNFEYGAYGIGAIALIRYFRKQTYWWLGWIALHLSLFFLQPSFASFQFTAVSTPLIFYTTTYERGQKVRWFYWFYPAHLLALWLLKFANDGGLPLPAIL